MEPTDDSEEQMKFEQSLHPPDHDKGQKISDRQSYGGEPEPDFFGVLQRRDMFTESDWERVLKLRLDSETAPMGFLNILI